MAINLDRPATSCTSRSQSSLLRICEAQCSVQRNKRLYCVRFFFFLFLRSYLEGWTGQILMPAQQAVGTNRRIAEQEIKRLCLILFWNICSWLKLFLRLLHAIVKVSNGGQGMFWSPVKPGSRVIAFTFTETSSNDGWMRGGYLFKRCIVDACARARRRPVRAQHKACLQRSETDFVHWVSTIAIIAAAF